MRTVRANIMKLSAQNAKIRQTRTLLQQTKTPSRTQKRQALKGWNPIIRRQKSKAVLEFRELVALPVVKVKSSLWEEVIRREVIIRVEVLEVK